MAAENDDAAAALLSQWPWDTKRTLESEAIFRFLGENRLIYIKCDSINVYLMALSDCVLSLWAQNIKYVDRFICKSKMPSFQKFT